MLGEWATRLSGLDVTDPAVQGVAGFAASALLPATYVRWYKAAEAESKRLNNPEIRKKRSLLHDKFALSKVPADVDYIVVGSGMGGLSCAAMLARMGRRVLVLESHPDTLGGGTHQFNLKGFDFDSGLHYTVPWSVPLLALSCLKKPKNCLPFDLMTEPDGTVDRIMFVDDDKEVEQLRMRYREGHLEEIYAAFPEEKAGLDQYMEASNQAMTYVKLFLFARLLPRWMQRWFWALVPQSIVATAASTAKELLPKFIKSKKLVSILSSMWIDTGARPDKATFMLTASVFRGVAMEGGSYPRGGSAELAKELVTVIESAGGKCLIRAKVASLCFDVQRQCVSGVRLLSGQELRCLRGVVSATGYFNTVNNLLPRELALQFNVPTSLPIGQSPGFVMANIGLACCAEDIGATTANTWHVPLRGGDIFEPIERYFTDPLAADSPMSAFITFPSCKDRTYAQQGKVSCQILMLAEFDWFQKYRQAEDEGDYALGEEARREEYAALKARWAERCVELLCLHFPRARPYIQMVDLSTPLTIEHYLRGVHGGAVGIDVCPQRFTDPHVRDALDCQTNVPGLWLTGQDSAICGVTLCQLSGAVTAMRMEGLCAAVRAVAQSVILGD